MGHPRYFTLGAAFLLLGSVWMALFATRPWHYLVGFGLLVGTGASFSTIVPVTTTITRWFRRYRGRAMAIVMTASGTAGFITAPLMNKLMVRTGGNWRLAWWIIAAVAVIAVLLVWLGVREHPEDLGQLPDGSHRDEILANPSAHGTKPTGPWARPPAISPSGCSFSA